MPHYIGERSRGVSRHGGATRRRTYDPAGLLRDARRVDRQTVRRLVPILFLSLTGAILTGCGSAGRRPPIARPAPPGGVEAPAPAGIAATALAFRGVPYRPGGADPSGFDCSGLVQYVFAQHGLAMPRLASEQFAFGRQVGRGDIEAGDLLFFATGGRGVSHVGIAVDETRFVHAPTTRGVVRIESLATPYWRTRYVAARRVLEPQAAR